jgi:cytochrome b561
MQIFNTPQRYGAVAQFLHWSTAVFVVLAWVLGQTVDDLPKAVGLFAHVSAGLAVLAIVIVRLMWRLVDAPPKAEVTPLGVWLDRAGRAAHLALYVLLIAVPVVGIVTQFGRGQPLPLFGLTEIVSPWPADRAFARSAKGLHETLSNVLLIIAAIHAVAALGHHWLLRDRTLARMLPGGAR